jgi:cell division protein FtsB
MQIPLDKGIRGISIAILFYFNKLPIFLKNSALPTRSIAEQKEKVSSDSIA